MAALHLCVEMRLNVTDRSKVCMSHKEDIVVTLLKPPSLLFVLSARSPLLDVFCNRFCLTAYGLGLLMYIATS